MKSVYLQTMLCRGHWQKKVRSLQRICCCGVISCTVISVPCNRVMKKWTVNLFFVSHKLWLRGGMNDWCLGMMILNFNSNYLSGSIIVKLRFSSWWNSQIRQITDENYCLLFSYLLQSFKFVSIWSGNVELEYKLSETYWWTLGNITEIPVPNNRY